MARQSCLTATDVKDLLPITKTGRKRTVTDDVYIGVLAKKLQVLTNEDCESTGAAARGHILEPYAIKMYNEETSFPPGSSKFLYHWDDIVVTRQSFKKFSLGFSPDALDAEPPKGRNMLAANGFECVGEVKSYYPTKHLVCANTPADQLEERWQIAVAMAVCETIEEGRLLFYNPSMPNDMLYVVEYNRADLADEIDIVLDVEDKWLTFVDNYNMSGGPVNDVYVDGLYEQEIIRDIMRREELNPEGEKSVIA
jgi:hypothetical protein